MNEETKELSEENSPEAEVNPWAQAFEAINKRNEESSDSPETDGEASQEPSSTDGVQSSTSDTNATSDDVRVDGEVSGGQTTLEQETDGVDPESTWGVEQAEAQIKEIENSITAAAMRDVVASCHQKGLLTNRRGELGATIDNPAIYRQGEDGVAEFINPDTGRPFTGDDPRRQAQQWCDQYNQELRDAFNKATAARVQELRAEQQPVIELIKFAPTYDKLDDTRKAMFEEVISDYEVTDKSGEVIGYSCDLNKALSMVDRQIGRLKTMAPREELDQQPTSPAMDMKATGAASITNNANPKSLEEAFGIIEQRKLDKRKR